jgi:molecular chaperone GrpE
MAEKKQKKKKPTLKDQISELNSQVSDEKDKFLRLFAEFENYRKRTAKERLELFKTASQELMTALLPIADDMDRALTEMKKSEDAENLQGFELIYSKFNDILKAKGLTLIDVKIGDKFDSENHEAITQIKSDKEDDKGIVIDIVEKGYKLGEKVIRYPKVVVAI